MSDVICASTAHALVERSDQGAGGSVDGLGGGISVLLQLVEQLAEVPGHVRVQRRVGVSGCRAQALTSLRRNGAAAATFASVSAFSAFVRAAALTD